MITIKQLNKIYTAKKGSIQALQDINLTINAGEIFGIIGKSGAGKSTLVRCMNLLDIPTTGIVNIAGENLVELNHQQLRAMRRQIGMIFQHFNLLSAKTVYDNIALPLKLAGIPSSKIHKQVTDLLELVELSDKQHYYPSQLSGGQKQRVGIARALTCQPKVLLCDEATSALDPQTTYSVLKLLQKINHELGLTIVLITHEMDVIKTICHRMAVLDKGHIVEQGDVIQLFTHPENIITQQLINSCLLSKLPPALLNKLQQPKSAHSHPVLKITFVGDVVTEPVISQLVREMSIDINILHADFDHIQNQTLGMMVCELFSNGDNLAQVTRYLTERKLTVEVLGYVPSDVPRAA